MRNKLRHIILSAALLGSCALHAQDRKLDTVEFNVVSKYKPVITEAEKLNNNPNIADTTKVERKADYNNLINKQFPTVYTPAPIDAIHMKGEPLDKLYHSYLDLGVGTYNTLYGEYNFNCLRSRNFDYGVHLNHLSSMATLSGEGNSTYAFNDVNLYGETFLQKYTLYAKADFDNHILHDYGYDVNKDKLNNNDAATLEQFNYFAGEFNIRSTYKDSTNINNETDIKYYNFSDIDAAQENSLNAKVHAYTYYDKQRIDVVASAQYYQDQNRAQDTAKTLNLEINPYFTANEKHWDARLGIKADYDARNGVTAYPDFIGRYHVAGDIMMIYAGIDGGKTFDSYRSLAAMNPYIQDTLNMEYTFTKVHIFGGITGTFSPRMTYNLSGYESEIENMPLFVTDTNEILRNRFSVIYDKVRVINGHGDISYQVKEDFKLTLGADYNDYSTTNQLKAWYNPNLNINLLGQYAIQAKYVIKANVFVLGPQYAPIMSDGIVTAKQIAAYPDINIGFDYHHNTLLTVFLNLNNIANISYQRWLNYPTQGFNAMVGVRLAF